MKTTAAPDTPFDVRPGAPTDVDAVARQFVALWPDGTLSEHRTEAASILSGTPLSTMPLVLFVAELQGVVIGFIEVGLRSHADGCNPERPVGFIEGWYVDPEHRRRGVGKRLAHAAQDWARTKGCHEIASDTWIDNEPSQQAHLALGFEVEGRCVNFKKSLR